MDYAMPKADNFPEIKIDYTCTPATSNPLGSKGCGEAGAIAAPPAVMNAVIDALEQIYRCSQLQKKFWEVCNKNKNQMRKLV